MRQQYFSISTTSECKKVQMNSIIAVKIRISSKPISVLTTQTALTDIQNIICRSPPPSQNFGAKKANATTRMTLFKPPIKKYRLKIVKIYKILLFRSCGFSSYQGKKLLKILQIYRILAVLRRCMRDSMNPTLHEYLTFCTTKTSAAGD